MKNLNLQSLCASGILFASACCVSAALPVTNQLQDMTNAASKWDDVKHLAVPFIDRNNLSPERNRWLNEAFQEIGQKAATLKSPIPLIGGLGLLSADEVKHLAVPFVDQNNLSPDRSQQIDNEFKAIGQATQQSLTAKALPSNCQAWTGYSAPYLAIQTSGVLYGTGTFLSPSSCIQFWTANIGYWLNHSSYAASFPSNYRVWLGVFDASSNFITKHDVTFIQGYVTSSAYPKTYKYMYGASVEGLQPNVQNLINPPVFNYGQLIVYGQ